MEYHIVCNSIEATEAIGMGRRLCDISPGDIAVVSGMYSQGSIRRRLRDIGFVEGAEVECLMKSPLGDPAAYLIKGAVIALRREDAASVMVEGK